MYFRQWIETIESLEIHGPVPDTEEDLSTHSKGNLMWFAIIPNVEAWGVPPDYKQHNMVGWIVLSPNNSISTVNTHPDYLRQGISSKLHDVVYKYVKNKGDVLRSGMLSPTNLLYWQKLEKNKQAKHLGNKRFIREYVNPEQVLSYFDYHDSYKNLYPGYNKFDNQYEDDYYFRNKKEALQAANEIIGIFKSLPDPIPIFRTISVKNQQEIDQERGESWSFRKESALEFGVHAGCNYLLSGFIRKLDVDWNKTIQCYVLNSHGRWGDGEDEIVVHNPEKIMNFKAEPIRKHK